MHRIDTSTAQKDKFGAGKNGFTSGNAQIGVPATEVSPDILDSMQEEICAVIEDADSLLILDKSKNNQLLTAIKKIIRSLGMSASESSRGNLQIATQLQTDTGNDDSVAVTPKKLRYGFSFNLGPNGYLALPSWLGGFIFQWCDLSVTSGWVQSSASGTSTPIWQGFAVATLPVAFIEKHIITLPVTTGTAQGSGWGATTGFVHSPTKTGFSMSIIAMFNPANSMSLKTLSIGK